MQPEHARDRPRPWGDRIIELFPCSRRRDKPNADSRLERHNDVEAMQLVTIETAAQTETDSNFTWGRLDAILAGLETAVEVFPPLTVAFRGLRDVIQRTEISKQNAEEYGQIASELQAHIATLQRYVDQAKPTWMAQSIAKIARSLEKENQFIRAQQGRDEKSKIASASRDEYQIIQSYRRVETLFRQLQTDISLSTWNSVREHHIASLLERLLPSPSAWYDAALSAEAYRASCTPGTRESVIEGFLEWAGSPTTSKLYWTNGMPGTGKTTIAYTLCTKLESSKQLGACFFCSRIFPDCRDVNRVFPTIAHQLAQFSNPYRNKLFDLLSETPNIAQRNIAVQFKNLILEPLLSVKDALPADIVIVIDALDECSSGGEQVLTLLLKNATQLPMKFFVTSRPDPRITQQMETIRSSSSHQVFHLHEIEKSFVQQDITIYFQHTLDEYNVSASPKDIETLAAYVGNLFIVAATTVRYILGHGSAFSAARSRERMDATLEMLRTRTGTERQYAAIDSLYTGILEKVLEQGQLEEKEVVGVRRVLWTTLCLREPLSLRTLSKVLSMKLDTVHYAVELLQSVLHLSETTGMVSTFHASFPDFMFSKERAGRFHCHQQTQENYLARNCFDQMATQLRFNICNLRSSYHRDQEIKNLKSQVDFCITPELFYACRYWADHLNNTPYSEESASLLRTFLHEYLLFWIEVINLKGWVSNGGDMMERVLNWLPQNAAISANAHSELDSLRNTIHDAQNFVTSFSASEASQSTPHLYISSLPALSKHSTLFAHHRQKFQGLPDLSASPTLGSRGASALAVWTIGSNGVSTAVSPNGTHLALSRHDGSIQIMDIRRGEFTLDLVGGHTRSGPIVAVSFSPNGYRLASGSTDGTICIWDTATGSLLAGPIHEHVEQITRVVFSPDNNVLASASGDGFFCLWDVQNGTLPSLQFKSDQANGWIHALAFSPDGSQLASAGQDLGICLRSTKTRTMLIPPLRGHNNAILCVHFSSDGSRLVSASRDQTIRVWQPQDGTLLAGPFQVDLYKDELEVTSLSPDPQGLLLAYSASDATIRVISTQTGDLVSGPFTGHTSSIDSLHFLPSGTHIISSSFDGTIRTWDARYNVVEPVIAHPGHTESIYSVTFSPDGAHVASGAGDGTVCIWDATSGALVWKLSDGHTDDIGAITFSPDGKKLASSSDDGSICIWDPHSGTLLGNPLIGHKGSVRDVNFSPEGSQLVSGGGDHMIWIWNLENDEVSSECLSGHTNVVCSAQFSPDATLIVSGSCDYTVGLWDAQKSNLLWMELMHTGYVNSVVFSPDGRLIASGSEDHTILLWESSTGTLVGEPLAGHNLSVEDLKFSPDGKTIASGSLDHSIRLWDIYTRKLKQPPFEGYSGVNSIDFSPNGRHIVSGSRDASIRKWDATTISDSTVDETTWVTRKDGWVTDQNSRMLVWLPYDSRGRLFLDPRNVLAIVLGQPIVPATPNLDGFFFGEEWHRCYHGSTS